MTIHILIEGEVIHIRQRAEGPGIVGDATARVTPGQNFYGWSFEELKALGNGGHEIEPKPAE